MTRPGALLDIDGTLLDTSWLHTVAWWRAFRSLGREVPMASIHRLIGMGGDKLVPELFGEPLDGAEAAYGDQFSTLRGEAIALPGARDLVRCLDELDVTVVLASSAKGDDLEAFRSVLDVDDHLAGATSSDDADRSKPDRDIFEAALDRFDLDRAQTIVVGDTGWDGDAARRAHLTFVGVCSGGWTEVDLSDRGASEVFPTPAELVATLRGDRPASWLPW